MKVQVIQKVIVYYVNVSLFSSVRKNIQKSLAAQIQEVAAVLRHQQKGLLNKLKDINSTGTSDLNTQSEVYKISYL